MIFRSQYSSFLFLLLFLISILISLWYYKKSVFDKKKRVTLIVLRTISLFLLLSLLLSPVIEFIKNKIYTPLNIILIDNSASIKIDNKDSVLKSILKEKFLFSNSKFDNKYYSFSDGLLNEIEAGSLEKISFDSLNNNKTDLTKALIMLNDKFANRNVNSVLLLTDGIINSGGNPLYSNILYTNYLYNIIGDTIQKPDIVVDKIIHNKSAYVQTKTPVKIYLRSYGISKTAKINVYEDDKVIDVITQNLDLSQTDYYIDYFLNSSQPGIKKYKVEVENDSKELTSKNNYEEFFIKYFPSKFNIILINGSPSADYALLSSQLKRIENYSIKYFTLKSANEFYEGSLPEFTDNSIVILDGFPTKQVSDNLINQINERINKIKIPVFFLLSSNTDIAKLKLFEKILPFIPDNSVSSYETSLRVTTNLTDNDNYKFTGIEAINSFPPVFVSRGLNYKPESEIVISSSSGNEPVLAIYNTNGSKSASFAAYNYFKWRLNPNNYDYKTVITSIFTGVINRIVNIEDSKKINIEANQVSYTKFEKVILKAQLNIPDLNGTEKVKINITSKNYTNTIFLNKNKDNIFEGETQLNNDGDYEVEASLYQNDIEIDKDYTKFIIGENNYEYKNTRSNDLSLRPLLSAGKSSSITNNSKNEIEKKLSDLSENSDYSYTATEKLILGENVYVLLLIILLLCTEWFLRKRFNLP